MVITFFFFSISAILNFTCRDLLSLQCFTTEHTVHQWVEINSEYCLGKQDKSTSLSQMRYKITLLIKYACYKILFLFYIAASIMISLSHQCSFHALFRTDGVLHSLCSLCFLSCDFLCRKTQISMDVCDHIPVVTSKKKKTDFFFFWIETLSLDLKYFHYNKNSVNT